MELLAAQRAYAAIALPPQKDGFWESDLQAALMRFTARAGASHALLVMTERGKSSPQMVCSVSIDQTDSDWASANADAVAKLLQAMALHPAGAEPIWEQWPAHPSGNHALCARLPAGQGEILDAMLLFNPEVQEGKARAFARPVWPDMESYFSLWCWHNQDRRRIAGLTAALNMAQLAMMVLDAEGELLFSNRAADELLQCSAGLRRNGRSIAPTDYEGALRFQVAVRHVLAEQMSAEGEVGRPRVPILSLPRGHGERALVCAILPVGQQTLQPGDPAIVVYVLSPHADTGRLIQPVCLMYGLSPVETRLVTKLASGLSLCEAAYEMRIKECTARSYIKHIFVKTDTNRQVDLVRLMLTSIVPVFDDVTTSSA